MRPGFEASAINVSIARLTGFHSRHSVIGARGSRPKPQAPARKVLYRRGVLSHALSQGLSHGLSHDFPVSSPIVPPAREGRRRMFSEADKQQILQEAMRPDARFSEVAHRWTALCSGGSRN